MEDPLSVTSKRRNITVKIKRSKNKCKLPALDNQIRKKEIKFRCRFCFDLFPTKEERSEHCKIDHFYKFSCRRDKCGQMFISRDALKDHVSKEHLNKKRWPCNFCDKSFLRRSTRRWHAQLHHEGKLFKCNECYVQYYSKESLESHMNLIHKNVRFSCDYCNYQTSLLRRLRIHQKKHGNNQTDEKKELMKVQCVQCEKKFHRKVSLRKHELIHHEGWRVQCHLCSRKFTTNRCFRKHFINFHEKNRSKFKCEKCDYYASKESHMVDHKNKYHKLTYPCIACNFAGESQQELKIHKMKHEEECHGESEPTPLCGMLQIQKATSKEQDESIPRDPAVHEVINQVVINEAPNIQHGDVHLDLVKAELTKVKIQIENQISNKVPVSKAQLSTMTSLMDEYNRIKRENILARRFYGFE